MLISPAVDRSPLRGCWEFWIAIEELNTWMFPFVAGNLHWKDYLTDHIFVKPHRWFDKGRFGAPSETERTGDVWLSSCSQTRSSQRDSNWMSSVISIGYFLLPFERHCVWSCFDGKPLTSSFKSSPPPLLLLFAIFICNSNITIIRWKTWNSSIWVKWRLSFRIQISWL